MAITGKMTSWFLVGSSLGAMTFPMLIGQLFGAVGPEAVMSVVLVALLAVFGLLLLQLAIGGPAHGAEGA